MKYDSPFIKVTWEDTPENFTQEKIRRVKSYFQDKYNTKNIRVITKTLKNNSDTKLASLDTDETITDTQYQKKLMKEFIKENAIEVNWELLDRLDNRVNGEWNKTNTNQVKYNKWYIKKIEFSNFLSFGDNNTIDFTTFDGITVIESTPKNFGGKSTSSVDLLMFLFFNSTTKTETNSEVFNKFTEKDEVRVRGELTIDGDDYVIERKLVRKKSKVGEYKVSSVLEYYKKNEDGTTQNLTGEQRIETEKFIANAIGTEEDFLTTIMTTGNNLEQLIESKPTARGRILTKFLGLETLRTKEEIAREIYNNWSKNLISNTNNKTELEIANQNLADQILGAENEIERSTKSIEENTKQLKNVEERRDHILSLRNNDIDEDLAKLNPTILINTHNDLIEKKNKIIKLAEGVDVVEPSSFYDEVAHAQLKDEINTLIVDGRINADSIKQKESLLKQFEEGSICPTCKRALDDIDHTDEINEIKSSIEKLKEIQVENRKKYDSAVAIEKKFAALKSEYDLYEKNKLIKAKHEIEIETKNIEIDIQQGKIDKYENNKKRLDENFKIDTELVSLRTRIETINADIRIANSTIERNKMNIVSFNEKVTTNNELIKKIVAEQELAAIFKVYLTVFGKNGISKVIMKNMIPLLNQELYRLLVDSCYFVLELNVNDKNEVEFIMIDTESRVVKPLNAGSGYEKTISSLALRSVLTKISSLPKPNIVVMDEVFGKIADENLEMVGEFFKKIKQYFDHVVVISHNPLIRNWSDNIMMIKKEENVSSIDYIKTKI
jgi:DNA repair exonuclease SbcCD ATPase subunit